MPDSLCDYSFPWYQNHLWTDGTVFRSPYLPDRLGRQSLDLYIPSLQTAIEYQGIQHYSAVGFFGGEEALAQRQELDRIKKQLCEENRVRLIEWPYQMEPTDRNIREFLLK